MQALRVTVNCRRKCLSNADCTAVHRTESRRAVRERCAVRPDIIANLSLHRPGLYTELTRTLSPSVEFMGFFLLQYSLCINCSIFLVKIKRKKDSC